MNKTVTTELEKTIKEILTAHSPAELLRAFSVVCRAEYEARSSALYEKYSDRRSGNSDLSLFHEPERDERTDADVASAWLCVASIDHLADSFDERIRRAGQSREEYAAENRRIEIEKKKAELERLLSNK